METVRVEWEESFFYFLLCNGSSVSFLYPLAEFVKVEYIKLSCKSRYFPTWHLEYVKHLFFSQNTRIKSYFKKREPLFSPQKRINAPVSGAFQKSLLCRCLGNYFGPSKCPFFNRKLKVIILRTPKEKSLLY